MSQPKWMKRILKAHRANKITKDDYEKCKSAIDSVAALDSFIDTEVLSQAFVWDNHDFGDEFWRGIDRKINRR